MYILLYYCIFVSVVSNSVFFEEKWQYDATKANIVNSLVYIISAVASPFLGFAVDRTGFNVMWGEELSVGVHVCVCARVRAHACMCVCVHACVLTCMCV